MKNPSAILSTYVQNLSILPEFMRNSVNFADRGNFQREIWVLLWVVIHFMLISQLCSYTLIFPVQIYAKIDHIIKQIQSSHFYNRYFLLIFILTSKLILILFTKCSLAGLQSFCLTLLLLPLITVPFLALISEFILILLIVRLFLGALLGAYYFRVNTLIHLILTKIPMN